MGVSFFGFSATIASVVMSRPAIEAASCSAVRTSLVGSNDPVRHEVFELAGLRVEAEGIGVVVLDLAHYHRTVFACVDRDLSRWPGERLFDHLDAVPLVFVFALQLVQGLTGTQQSDTTPGEDAFLAAGPSRAHAIFNAFL